MGRYDIMVSSYMYKTDVLVATTQYTYFPYVVGITVDAFIESVYKMNNLLKYISNYCNINRYWVSRVIFISLNNSLKLKEAQLQCMIYVCTCIIYMYSLNMQLIMHAL